jgi:hypothetical protein
MLFIDGLMIICDALPPWKMPHGTSGPLRLGHASYVFEIRGASSSSRLLSETSQRGRHINQFRLRSADERPVTAQFVLGRVVHKTRDDGIEVNVREEVAKVQISSNEPRPIPALPTGTEHAVTPVVRTGYPGMDCCHAPP